MRQWAFLLAGVLAAFGLGTSAVQAADKLLGPEVALPEAIDHYVAARQQAQGVEPAPLASDEILVRRTYLDLVGRPPTATEVRAYLDSDDADKRQKLVDELLASEGYVRHQVNELDWLIMQGQGNLREYLTHAVNENRPWDDVFRDLIEAENTDDAPGSREFLRSRLRDVDQLNTDVSVLFFGVNVSCAQCHDHPEVWTWTQDVYYGMKSFFNRTVEVGDYVGERSFGTVNYQTPSGEGRSVGMMFLDGTTIDDPSLPTGDLSDDEKKALKQAEDDEKKVFDESKKDKKAPPAPEFSRRRQLIDVALRSEGEGPRLMARSIVNRLWVRLHGRGLVEPVDQMHDFNDPSHPELLEWLARDLREHSFDLKRTLRGMVLSDTYARDSYFAGEVTPEPDMFAVGVVRPLSPRQYGAALRLATQDPDSFDPRHEAEQIQQRAEGAAKSGEGLQNHFAPLTESFAVGANEALLLSNNERFERDLLDSGLVRRLLQLPDDEVLTQAVWSIYARPPQAEELELLGDFVKQSDDRDRAIRNLVWALVTSPELRFNY